MTRIIREYVTTQTNVPDQCLLPRRHWLKSATALAAISAAIAALLTAPESWSMASMPPMR